MAKDMTCCWATKVQFRATRATRCASAARRREAGVETMCTETPEGGQVTGYRDATAEHMQNFFDCMRSRKEPNCPFEIGYRAAIACQMSITSYHKKRAVRWDPKTEDIV